MFRRVEFIDLNVVVWVQFLNLTIVLIIFIVCFFTINDFLILKLILIRIELILVIVDFLLICGIVSVSKGALPGIREVVADLAELTAQDVLASIVVGAISVLAIVSVLGTNLAIVNAPSVGCV